MTVRSLIKNLLIVLVLLSAWVAYDNWDRVSDLSPAAVKDAVSHSMTTLPSEGQKSRTYQWTDDLGKVHVSNTPPENARNVKIIEYDDNLNVLPSNPESEQKPRRLRKHRANSRLENQELLRTYSRPLEKARDVQKLVDERANTLREKTE